MAEDWCLQFSGDWGEEGLTAAEVGLGMNGYGPTLLTYVFEQGQGRGGLSVNGLTFVARIKPEMLNLFA